MRVLFYLGDKEWSGCARAALAGARGLAARGHHVTVACCADSRLDTLAKAAGIETVSINTTGWSASGTLDLRKVLKERFIEVAVVSAERDHLIVASAMRAAGRGGVLRRVPAFDQLQLQRSGRLALKLASTGVVVATAGELDYVKSVAGWSIPPAVVPIGVDIASFDGVEPATRAEMHAPKKGVLIACSYDPSGRFRMGTVFRTIALLAARHPNMHVVVFGPGSTDDDLRMHAAALGVGPVISFLGERDDDRQIMRAANAGWVVAGSDAAAFACLDFMSLRVPVVAERTPLSQHYVADGITGLLLSPGDASYTASGVAAFLNGDDKRAAMGNAGRTRVQREFAEPAMIDAFERAVHSAGDRTTWSKK
ncbi:MAG: glycosyl transferase group 1 [Gemmatimonadetes bacterium]|nr:glycosyl transferase group 1 [Gemmatimonadota bacterium]